MDFSYIKELDNEYCIQSYNRHDVAINYGKGACLYDSEGRKYIDFSGGIGVASIGYRNRHWAEEIARQACKLSYASNLFYTEPYIALAARLAELAGMEAVFFANSGAEANECAIKIARKYSYDKYGIGRSTIITLCRSFHGRTMAALSATGQADYHRYFYPFVNGFRHVEANNAEALKDAMTADVCAVMIEPIQGNGGIYPLEDSFINEAVRLTSGRDVLLIVDEVQTGNGRTGEMYCYQGYGVEPDIVTTAKGLGGGLPIGAVMVNDKCRNVLSQGTHGSTFGANPVCCAAANAVLDILTEPGFLDRVKEKGDKIINTVNKWKISPVKEARGKGLMIGIQIVGISSKQAASDLIGRGLIVLTAGDDVLRLLPPLTISEEEIDTGLEILYSYLSTINDKKGKKASKKDGPTAKKGSPSSKKESSSSKKGDSSSKKDVPTSKKTKRESDAAGKKKSSRSKKEPADADKKKSSSSKKESADANKKKRSSEKKSHGQS